jgi:hypothetical protein
MRSDIVASGGIDVPYTRVFAPLLKALVAFLHHRLDLLALAVVEFEPLGHTVEMLLHPLP